MDEQMLLAALRAGNEAAFMHLVDQYHAAMVRLAMVYVQSTMLAEEVAQETWLRMLKSLDRFEGRSSLKTWLFRILTNTAITYGKREGRQIPFSDLERAGDEADERSVDPERFIPSEDREWAGSWAVDPQPWAGNVVEDRLVKREIVARIQQAIEALPANQRAVITLHDVDGWESKEICNVLEISETNQRVLLHRARSRVRQALERYFEEADKVR
jgi:RNA polymerase sigma-70 factor (ECF subfamily)